MPTACKSAITRPSSMMPPAHAVCIFRHVQTDRPSGPQPSKTAHRACLVYSLKTCAVTRSEQWSLRMLHPPLTPVPALLQHAGPEHNAAMRHDTEPGMLRQQFNNSPSADKWQCSATLYQPLCRMQDNALSIGQLNLCINSLSGNAAVIGRVARDADVPCLSPIGRPCVLHYPVPFPLRRLAVPATNITARRLQAQLTPAWLTTHEARQAVHSSCACTRLHRKLHHWMARSCGRVKSDAEPTQGNEEHLIGMLEPAGQGQQRTR